jgi:hypothetical protein
MGFGLVQHAGQLSMRKYLYNNKGICQKEKDRVYQGYSLGNFIYQGLRVPGFSVRHNVSG